MQVQEVLGPQRIGHRRRIAPMHRVPKPGETKGQRRTGVRLRLRGLRLSQEELLVGQKNVSRHEGGERPTAQRPAQQHSEEIRRISNQARLVSASQQSLAGADEVPAVRDVRERTRIHYGGALSRSGGEEAEAVPANFERDGQNRRRHQRYQR